MNSTLITMEPEVALKKLKAFRADSHKDAEDVYQQCAEAYAALAKGTPLIALTQAIREGGFDDRMRPNIAIARADQPEVRFEWSSRNQMATFSTTIKWRDRSRRTHESYERVVDLGRLHGLSRHLITAYARVPMVPADVRPKTGQLRDWFVLWEVTDWSDKPHTAAPPVDPYLLKHIGGDLYAVLAEWDLTELERAIMRNLTAR